MRIDIDKLKNAGYVVRVDEFAGYIDIECIYPNERLYMDACKLLENHNIPSKAIEPAVEAMMDEMETTLLVQAMREASVKGGLR
jgi:hypothetical protein